MLYRRLAWERALKLASIGAMGMLLQAGGCGLSLDTLFPSFVSSFVALGVSDAVNNVFGLGF